MKFRDPSYQERHPPRDAIPEQVHISYDLLGHVRATFMGVYAVQWITNNQGRSVTMRLRFRDAYDHLGRITDEFAVEYAGPLPVDEYVQTVVAETTATEETVEELIIGLVQDLDVQETRRAEPPATPPQP